MLQKYEDALKNRQNNRYASLVANLSQNPYFFNTSSVMPALLRGSSLWSFEKSREVLPEELCEVQGMNIYSPDDMGFACPFRSAVANDVFTARQLSQMAGNAMHMAAIGTALTFVLAGTESCY